jgi:hypothetical protein
MAEGGMFPWKMQIWSRAPTKLFQSRDPLPKQRGMEHQDSHEKNELVKEEEEDAEEHERGQRK